MRRHARAGAGAAARCVGRGDKRIRPMVDVEERPLRALEQNLAFRLQRFVQEHRRVRDERFQLFPCGECRVVDFLERNRLPAQQLQQRVVFLHARCEFFRENIGLHQIHHAQPGAIRLVGVSRPDAAFCRSDFRFALRRLARAVEGAVVAEDEMCRVADEQIFSDLDFLRAQSLDLLDERDRINDDTVADDALFLRAQNARRDQVQHIFFAAGDDCVARVVATLRADDDVRFFGEEVDDLALAFVAPLGTDENCVRHFWESFGWKENNVPTQPASGPQSGRWRILSGQCACASSFRAAKTGGTRKPPPIAIRTERRMSF